MKYTFSILLVIASWSDLDRIAKINKLKKEAKRAYQTGDYSEAISKYHYLLDSMKVEDYGIRLNLANAYYQSNDTTNALNNYGLVTESNLNVIRSTAYQQTGIIEYNQGEYKEALGSFKRAIKSDPANEQARYNYEMLKKFLKEQEQNKDQQQKQDNKDQKKQDKGGGDNKDKKDQQNKDQKNKDQKNKDQKKQDKEGEDNKGRKDQEKQDKEGEDKDDQNKQEEMQGGAEEKLKEMKISEEKAKMILEALKNQEVQYIQQNRKKAKQRPENDKPDW